MRRIEFLKISLVSFIRGELFGVEDFSIDGFPKEWVKDDDRLNGIINIRSESVYLSNLIEENSNKLGVRISVSDEYSGSGVLLSALIKDKAASDMLDSLWSVLSIRNGCWQWERRLEKGKWAYLLRRTKSSYNFSKNLWQEMCDDYSGKYYEEMVEESKKSDIEIQEKSDRFVKAAQKDRHCVLNVDRNTALVQDKKMASALRLFSRRFERKDIVALMNGESRELPVSALTPEEHALVSQITSRADKDTVLRFTNALRGQDFELPLMSVQPFGTYWLGGGLLMQYWATTVRKKWVLPGDTVDHPLYNEALLKKAVSPEKGTALWKNMNEISESTGASFLSVVDDHWQQAGFSMDRQQKLKDILDFDFYFYLYKFRNDMLLVSTISWFARGATTEPINFPLLRELQEAAAKSEFGFLEIPRIARIFAQTRYTDEEFLRMAKSFPVLQQLLRFRALLTWAYQKGRIAELLSPEGIPGHPALLSPFAATKKLPDFPVRVRIQSTITPSGANLIEVFLLDEKGTKLHGISFSQSSHPLPSPGGGK